MKNKCLTHIKNSLAVLVLSASGLCTTAMANDSSARALIYDLNGQRIGSATFLEKNDQKILIRVKVHGVSPGFHGMHIHATGECTPPFSSAGGHFDLDGHTHRDHAADLPVLLVNADGSARVTLETDRFKLADLFDADGSAIIIHANPDNYANIPTRYVASPDASTLATGDAGPRIACGVLNQ